MLRLTEIKLPLGHSDDDIKAAIIRRLDIAADELLSHAVFKRGTDARKHNAILYSYTLDVALRDEAAILARFKNDTHVRVTPDTSYRFVTHAPQNLPSRPVVVGMGPAGIFAGLLLAQMGFRPLILERGKAVRERTKDTWGLWRQGVLNPESNVQFGEGGAGTFSDGKLYSQIKDPRFLGTQGAGRIRQGRRTRRDSVREPSAHRHVQAGGHGREDARDDTVAGWRDPFRKPRRRYRDYPRIRQRRTGYRGRARRRRAHRNRSSGAGGRPQRARHLRDDPAGAASISKPSRSRSASGSSTRSR